MRALPEDALQFPELATRSDVAGLEQVGSAHAAPTDARPPETELIEDFELQVRFLIY